MRGILALKLAAYCGFAYSATHLQLSGNGKFKCGHYIVILYACIFTVLSMGNFIRSYYDRNDRLSRIKIAVFFSLLAATCAVISAYFGLGSLEVIVVLSFCVGCFLILAFIGIALQNAYRNP